MTHDNERRPEIQVNCCFCGTALTDALSLPLGATYVDVPPVVVDSCVPPRVRPVHPHLVLARQGERHGEECELAMGHWPPGATPQS